jgi:hypothetical protein
MNELLTFAVMFNSLMVVDIKSVINADRIKESVKSGNKVSVCVARLPLSYQKKPYQKLWM